MIRLTREKGWKGKESRQRLLEAATTEFANRGFHETKVSTIVNRAGLTQPSFYLYFASKEAVFDELVKTFRTRLRHLTESARLEDGIGSKDVSQRVFMAVESVFQFLAADPPLTRIGLFLAPESEEIKAELTSLLKENLLAEQKAGYFCSELEMDTVAECLIGSMERLTVTYLLPGIKDPQSLAAQIVHLFMHGMLANEHVLDQNSDEE
jgi:TetR/AcrR family transcriptional regulator, fatty acid metabolism regulator protein